MTVTEWVILREMYGGDEKISPSAIADLTGLSRGAVSKLVDRLLNKGLVTRNESSHDRRYQQLKLSEKSERKKLVGTLIQLTDAQQFAMSIRPKVGALRKEVPSSFCCESANSARSGALGKLTL